MCPARGNCAAEFPLSGEHRMLLHIRDTLYEGSWEDFVRDLHARALGRPHVYQTVPDSPSLRAAIKGHLHMIAEMQAWETQHQCTLDAQVPSKGGA